MRSLLLLLALLTPSLSARAAFFEIPRAISHEALPPGSALTPLLKVTTDRGPEVYGLSLLSDSAGVPVGLYMAQMKKKPEGTAYLFSEIGKPAGVVLFESDGRKVLQLQGVFSRKKGQARFHLKYLSNGLWGSYRSCDVLLRNQDGKYFLQNAYTGKTVTATRVITSALGVDTLEGICPE